jgi:hypothetical protein
MAICSCTVWSWGHYSRSNHREVALKPNRQNLDLMIYTTRKSESLTIWITIFPTLVLTE